MEAGNFELPWRNFVLTLNYCLKPANRSFNLVFSGDFKAEAFPSFSTQLYEANIEL